MISVIVPTIGRPEALETLLKSLIRQTAAVDEVIVADGSGGKEVSEMLSQSRWDALGVQHLEVQPPNAVRQRQAAIAKARGEFLLLLDDDVELDPRCAEEMLKLLGQDPEVVAVVADFSNQKWSGPTRAWKLYMRLVHGIKEGEWQGRVIGPLLRFGYSPSPAKPMPMQWIGSGTTMIRRSAYEAAGGFSDFFLHRCTMNEDVDLGLKLARAGKILLSPSARLAHHHAPGGRVPPAVAAEDDLFNRYLVLRRTLGKSAVSAFSLVGLYFLIETVSGLFGCLRRLSLGGLLARTAGRARGLVRILGSARLAV